MIINYIDVYLRLPSKIRVILEIKILCIENSSNFVDPPIWLKGGDSFIKQLKEIPARIEVQMKNNFLYKARYLLHFVGFPPNPIRDQYRIPQFDVK